MPNRFLAFGLITILILAGCSKKPAPEGANPENPPAESAATPAPAPAAERAPRPETPKPVVIPAGTVLTVRLDQALGSKASHTGDTFSATVATPVSVGGKMAIPASSAVSGTVVEAKAKGKIKGEARLQLALKKITIKGQTYLIDASMAGLTEKGKGKRTAKTTGAGAAGGALIGGLAGGGKGLAIGAAVGAGAGLVGGRVHRQPANRTPRRVLSELPAE